MSADEQSIAGWTVGQHLAEACRLLEGPAAENDDWMAVRADEVATAHAHIALAQLLQTGNHRSANEIIFLSVRSGGAS